MLLAPGSLLRRRETKTPVALGPSPSHSRRVPGLPDLQRALRWLRIGARGVGWATAREPRDQGTQWPQPAQPGGGAQSPPAGSQGLRAPQPIGPRRPGKEHGGGQAPRRQLAQLRRVPPGERGASLAHGLQPQGQKPRRSYPSLCPGLSGTPEPETGSPSDRLRPLADLFRSGAGAGESASVRRGAPPADRFPNGRETPGAQSGPLAPATQVAFSLGWPERREGPFSPAPRSDCRALRRVPPAHRTRRAGLMPSHPPRLTPQGEVGASAAPGRRIPAGPRTSTGPLLRVSSHNVCFLWVRQAGGRSWPPWSTQSTPVPPRRARTQGTISSVWTHPFPGPTSHTHTHAHSCTHTHKVPSECLFPASGRFTAPRSSHACGDYGYLVASYLPCRHRAFCRGPAPTGWKHPSPQALAWAPPLISSASLWEKLCLGVRWLFSRFA